MSEDARPLYEGLFLMTQAAGADLSAATDHVRQVLDRAKAEVVALRKWDERKLAYPIEGQKRGTFLLALFRVDGVQIANIERDCNLSDEVLRVMILRGDHLGEIEVERALQDADTSAAEAKLKDADKPAASKPAPPAAAKKEDIVVAELDTAETTAE